MMRRSVETAMEVPTGLGEEPRTETIVATAQFSGSSKQSR